MVESGWQDTVQEKKVIKQTSDIQFQDIKQSKEQRGIKILSYGNFSTGKTHFALTAKQPVFIIDTENGASPLADKFPGAKILKINESINDDTDEKDEVKNFEKLQLAIDYLAKLPKEQVGTVILDSISDLWEWVQAYAKIKIWKIPVEQRPKQMFDWGIINKLYLKQLMKLINMNANVIVIARAGEEYAGAGQPTGNYKPQCQKKTPYWVDLVLFHEIHIMKGNAIFSAKIEKCRQNGDIIGKVIDSPNFQKIVDLIEKK